VAVGELRHFGQAAQRCLVSQPALSEQIRKLEAQLGVQLFERTNRRVEVTPQGRVLLAKAERVLAEARELLALAQHAGQPLAGNLTLAAIETLGPYYLPHLLRRMRAAFPGVVPHLLEGRTATLLEWLVHGELDLVLAALPLAVRGLETHALFFEPFLLVCPIGHRLQNIAAPGLDDLTDDDLLLLEEGHCLRDQALALCHAGHQRHATSLETLWHMIAAGEGYSLLPVLAVQSRPGMEHLIACRELAGGPFGRTIGLVWRAGDPRAQEFRQLSQVLRGDLPVGLAPVRRGGEAATEPPAPSLPASASAGRDTGRRTQRLVV
jgi:LysR family transcriptional regulator, hydrogen peroxide-inducible genes activator